MKNSAIYLMFGLCIIISFHSNGQDINSIFDSHDLKNKIRVLVDSAKINVSHHTRQDEYRNIDTSNFNFLPVLNATLLINDYSKKNAPILSEILIVDKQSSKIIGAVHFDFLGMFATCVKDKYFISKIMPWRESRLHYIPQNCYKSLSKKLKNESQRYYLISVLETRSVYILREQQLPILENRKEYPEPICQ